MGYAPVSQELLASYIGNGIGWLVKRALTGEMHATPDAALYEHALPIFEKHYTELLLGSKPYGGVIDGLEALRAAGFPMGCITNKAARFTKPLLEGTGLAKYLSRCWKAPVWQSISRSSCPATRCRKKSLIRCRCCMPQNFSTCRSNNCC